MYKRYELKNPCHPNLFKKENSTQNRVFSLNLISIILYSAPMNNWKSTQVIDWERVRNQHGYWTYGKTPDPERKTKLLENEPCQWLLMHIIEAKSAVKCVTIVLFQWHHGFSFGKKDLWSLKYPLLSTIKLILCTSDENIKNTIRSPQRSHCHARSFVKLAKDNMTITNDSQNRTCN